MKPVVFQQGSAGCLGIAAVWDSPYGLLEKASRLWLQMSQFWWKRIGGENAILSRVACLSNLLQLDIRADSCSYSF